MKLYAIAATLGLLTNVSAVNVSPTDTNVAFQTITVPDYSLTFERGTYEIIEMSYTAKTQLSDSQLTSILKQAGFSGNGLKVAKAIAFHESTNRPMALNRSSNCYGLFQINMNGSLGESRRERYSLESNMDLFNPIVNAKIAYQMSSGGKNWSAWTTAEAARKSLD